MTTMKAVRIHTYGDPEILSHEDAPRPEPGEGEVVIRVHATTVNPFDCAVRAGYLAGYFNHTLPLILGTDVTDFAPGDAVYADYALVSASDVALKPDTLDHVHVAALPHATLTVWQALSEAAHLAQGQPSSFMPQQAGWDTWLCNWPGCAARGDWNILHSPRFFAQPRGG